MLIEQMKPDWMFLPKYLVETFFLYKLINIYLQYLIPKDIF